MKIATHTPPMEAVPWLPKFPALVLYEKIFTAATIKVELLHIPPLPSFTSNAVSVTAGFTPALVQRSSQSCAMTKGAFLGMPVFGPAGGSEALPKGGMGEAEGAM